MADAGKNRFQAPLNKSLQAGIKAVIDCLIQQVKNTDELRNKIAENNEALSQKRDVLRTGQALAPLRQLPC